jgi:hydrogenase 3 maturation protease
MGMKKMSKVSWWEQLIAILNQKTKRLAIVGIGHELRGDDAVGVLIVRELQNQLRQSVHLLILDAGVAPENVTGQLRRFAPDFVLLIDAVDMGQDAGTIAIIDLNSKFVERITSTHTLSLRLFANYLQTACECTMQLLGIQPMYTTLQQPISSPVQSSIQSIVLCCLSQC